MNTVIDVLEPRGDDGEQHGFEVKVWSPHLSVYAAGTGGGHSSNGHLYGFGNTRESALRKVVGAPERGQPSDGTFDHATGKGYVSGSDWGTTERGKIKPDYRDAISNGRKLTVIVHEIYGGFDCNAVRLIEQRAEQAKGGRDGTDYSKSNTKSFKAHWTRRISASIMIAKGEHLTRQAALLASGGFVTRKKGAAGAKRSRDGGVIERGE